MMSHPDRDRWHFLEAAWCWRFQHFSNSLPHSRGHREFHHMVLLHSHMDKLVHQCRSPTQQPPLVYTRESKQWSYLGQKGRDIHCSWFPHLRQQLLFLSNSGSLVRELIQQRWCCQAESHSTEHREETQTLAEHRGSHHPPDRVHPHRQLHHTRGHTVLWSWLDGLHTCMPQHMMELGLDPLHKMLMDWQRQPPQLLHWTNFEVLPRAHRKWSLVDPQCRDKESDKPCCSSSPGFHTINYTAQLYMMLHPDRDRWHFQQAAWCWRFQHSSNSLPHSRGHKEFHHRVLLHSHKDKPEHQCRIQTQPPPSVYTRVSMQWSYLDQRGMDSHCS